jgi:signal transduction histidine kinase
LRPRFNHRVIFASALFLLMLSGLALGLMFYKTYSSERWVRHTYNAELLLSEIMFDINRTGRDRQTYLDTGDPQVLQGIQNTHAAIVAKLAQLKAMVQDNADQIKNCDRLEQTVKERFATFDASLQLFRSGESTHEAQDRYTQALIGWSRKTSAIARDINDVESTLLNLRSVNTQSVFSWAIVIAAFSYGLSLYVLWEHYCGLTRELQQRKFAEQNALKLRGQLLGAQDQERRKIARDLHDGLGQVLVAAKMVVDSLLNRPEDKQKLAEVSELLAEAVSSTRSISHLLHPPLVDELGFVAAAGAYLEGFSKRTGVEVNLDLTEPEERLPRDLELVMFRILQEALTNIQRHSKSAKAEVQFHADRREATLKIRDFGVGLPAEMMGGNRANLGVGLAGMKERVREYNGQFEIRSDSGGTSISVVFPLAGRAGDADAPTEREGVFTKASSG